MVLDSPPRPHRFEIDVLQLDTPMDIQPRVRPRDNLDNTPNYSINNAVKNLNKKRKFEEDPQLPPYISDEINELMDVRMVNLDNDFSLMQNLLNEMREDQKLKEFGPQMPDANLRADGPQLPFGHILFQDSHTGPGNDLGPYSVAEKEGPLSQASWEHDYLVGKAKGNVDLLKQIDERYLNQVDAIDMDPALKYFIKGSIQYGAPIYYKVRAFLDLDYSDL